MQEGQATLPIGAVIRGHYVVENVLNKGNAGGIYLVTDQRFKRTTPNFFVLKDVIDPHKQERYRLVFEGALLKQLHHHGLPHFDHVFNDEENGRVYIFMEYIEGPSLELLRQGEPRQRLSRSEAMIVMAPILDAVSYLHHQQPPIVHRDIKPTNIIVSQAEAARTVLVDFGVMKYPDTTPTGVRPYLPGYRAPELYSGDSDIRADVYGLGATFYTLVTGIVPPDGFSRLVYMNDGRVDPLKLVHEVLPTVPLSVAGAIDRAMSLSVDDRFLSVEQFWVALQGIADTPPRMPLPLSPPLPPSPSPLVSSPTPPETEWAGELGAITPLQGEPRVEGPRVSFFRKSGVLFIVLVLLIGLGVGAGFGLHTLSDTPMREEAMHRLFLLTPTIAPSTPTLTSISTRASPDSVSTIYPTLAGTYNGTIYDLAMNVSTNLSITNIRQNQGNISGYLIIGPKLQSNGPFSGTIDTTKHFRFIVMNAAGQPILFFEGAIQSPTSLSGNFYSCAPGPGNPCPRAPGSYGIWNVILA